MTTLRAPRPPAAAGRRWSADIPVRASCARPGVKRPTEGTNPNSTFSTTKTHTSTPMTAPMWLRTTAPTPTPIPPQSAAAASVPRPSWTIDAQLSERWIPRPERMPRPIASVSPWPISAKTIPASRLAAYLAVTTTQRRGVNTNVGRIVPNRYSPVTTRIPASAAKTEAKLPIPRKFRWSCGPLSEPVCDSNPVSSTNSSTSANKPTTSPIVVRVERIFRNSERV